MEFKPLFTVVALNHPSTVMWTVAGHPEVGGEITFVPGKIYYLRIDGCSGTVCPFQITVNPANALLPPANPIQPKWPATGLIQGKNPVACPGKTASYQVPLLPPATASIGPWRLSVCWNFSMKWEINSWRQQPWITWE